METGIGLTFPEDHHFHGTQIEWVYLWGKFSNGQFFHFANFAMNVGPFHERAIHSSIFNGEVRYSEEVSDQFNELKGFLRYFKLIQETWAVNTDELSITLHPQSKPVAHKVSEGRNYYSIPYLVGEGMIYPDEKVTVEAWLDHEFSIIKSFRGWDWVSVKLSDGPWIMAYKSDADSFCTVGMGESHCYSDFSIDGEFLHVEKTGSFLRLKPIYKETIFHPKFGVPYSEQPFYAISRGKVVGHGMRERAYKEKSNG